eukprot:scaffold1628_cov407-Prasinococcus_capsulatus_cf.AAC.14
MVSMDSKDRDGNIFVRNKTFLQVRTVLAGHTCYIELACPTRLHILLPTAIHRQLTALSLGTLVVPARERPLV